MNPTKWIGLLIGFLGFSLSLDFSSDFNFKISMPELAVIGAAIASVYGWILLRVVVKDHSISPLAANGYSMFFGGIFALLHSFLMESWQPLPMQIEYLPKVVSGIAAMTVISNLICYNLYGMMLRKFTATF